MKYFAFTPVIQLLLIAPAVIYRCCDGSSGWKRTDNAWPTEIWTLTAAPIAALKPTSTLRQRGSTIVHVMTTRVSSTPTHATQTLCSKVIATTASRFPLGHGSTDPPPTGTGLFPCHALPHCPQHTIIGTSPRDTKQ